MTFTFHRNDATFSAVSSTDVTNITNIATAWTTYNPTVTAQTGTFTSVSGAGWYQQIGKTVAITIKVTVTTSGTAANAVFADLPISAVVQSCGAGQEVVTNGAALAATFTSSRVSIVKYDNTTPPISSTSQLVVSGVYQSV
jgi:hypothetical protein